MQLKSKSCNFFLVNHRFSCSQLEFYVKVYTENVIERFSTDKNVGESLQSVSLQDFRMS